MPVKRAVDSLAVVFDRKRNLIDINTKALTEGAKEKC